MKIKKGKCSLGREEGQNSRKFRANFFFDLFHDRLLQKQEAKQKEGLNPSLAQYNSRALCHNDNFCWQLNHKLSFKSHAIIYSTKIALAGQNAGGT